MEEFKQELIEKSIQNVNVKQEKLQQMEKDRRENLEKVINMMYEKINENLEEKMREASENGYFSTTLYTFKLEDVINTEFGEFKLIFLFKGPKTNRLNPSASGLAYFESKGVKSLLSRLQEKYNTFGMYNKYNKSENTLEYFITWKN